MVAQLLNHEQRHKGMRRLLAFVGAVVLVAGTVSCAPRRAPVAEPGDPADAVLLGGRIRLVPPQGWVLRHRGVGWPSTPEAGSWCLTPRRAPRRLEETLGCAGLTVTYGPELPDRTGQGHYRPDQPGGWYGRSDVIACPIGARHQAGEQNHVTSIGGRPESGLRSIGSQQARWNRWHATCLDGSTFTPRAWYVPELDLLVVDPLGHPETSAVLRSATTRPPPDAGAVRRVTGWVTHVDGPTFTVQPFRTYGNGPAGRAYAEAHDLEFPFSNDYYDAPAGPPYRVDVTRALCTGSIVVAYHEPLGDTVVPCARFGPPARHGRQVTAALWLTSDTTAIQVSELSHP